MLHVPSLKCTQIVTMYIKIETTDPHFHFPSASKDWRRFHFCQTRLFFSFQKNSCSQPRMLKVPEQRAQLCGWVGCKSFIFAWPDASPGRSPTFLAPGTWFHGRQFFQGAGGEDGLDDSSALYSSSPPSVWPGPNRPRPVPAHSPGGGDLCFPYLYESCTKSSQGLTCSPSSLQLSSLLVTLFFTKKLKLSGSTAFNFLPSEWEASGSQFTLLSSLRSGSVPLSCFRASTCDLDPICLPHLIWNMNFVPFLVLSHLYVEMPPLPCSYCTGCKYTWLFPTLKTDLPTSILSTWCHPLATTLYLIKPSHQSHRAINFLYPHPCLPFTHPEPSTAHHGTGISQASVPNNLSSLALCTLIINYCYINKIW